MILTVKGSSEGWRDEYSLCVVCLPHIVAWHDRTYACPTSVRPSERPSRPVRFPCAYRAKFNSCVSATIFALPFYEKMKKDRDEKIHCRHWWGPRNAVTKDAHIHTTFRGKANFKCHQDVQILLIVVSHFPMQTSDSKTVEYERVSHSSHERTFHDNID